MPGESHDCTRKEVFDEIKETLRDHEKRIGQMEMYNATSTEQIKTIFRYLGDIKDSITKLSTDTASSITILAAKVDGISRKPGQWGERIILAVVIAVITAFVMRNLSL